MALLKVSNYPYFSNYRILLTYCNYLILISYYLLPILTINFSLSFLEKSNKLYAKYYPSRVINNNK